MKTSKLQVGVTVLAALTLAIGGTSIAQANEGYEEGHPGGHGHHIVVKGDDNQIVLGHDNNVARGDISTRDGGGNQGEEETAPREPYGTVHTNVAFLAERAQPNTTSAEVARFGPGTQVPLSCYVTGEDVHGNRTWYRVREENEFKTGYISAYYVTLHGAISRC